MRDTIPFAVTSKPMTILGHIAIVKLQDDVLKAERRKEIAHAVKYLGEESDRGEKKGSYHGKKKVKGDF